MATLHSRAAQGSAPVVAGLDLNDWPRHCRKLRRSLPKNVVYDPRPGQPFVAPAWKLKWQGTTLAIPAVNYQELTVVRQSNGEFFLALQAQAARPPQTSPPQTSPSAIGHSTVSNSDMASDVTVVLSRSAVQKPIQDVRVASTVFNDMASDNLGQQPLQGRRNLRQGQLLTQRLFDGPVSEDEILELAYRHQSRDLSCDLAAWEDELPIAIALDMRQEEAKTVVAAYPRVGQQAGRVLRHRRGAVTGKERRNNTTANRTEWQIQLGDSSQNRSEVWISLPEGHISSNVGLGMGQDNWWEAKDRPAWLDTLEAALQTTLATQTSMETQASETVWQTLATEIQQAGFSQNSVRSVQTLSRQE